MISGLWLVPYTGKTFTDPVDLHIDHLVPLKDTHVRGAASWATSSKRAYANDLVHPETLVAVHASANMSKGSRDPAEWLPDVNRCEYVRQWVVVKQTWELSMDSVEQTAIGRVQDQCR